MLNPALTLPPLMQRTPIPISVAARTADDPAGDRRPAATGTVIGITPYHPSWPARFRVESVVLRAALDALQPRFEHIGTTAVPRMPGRPIVDILLGLPRVSDLEPHLDRLRNFGYALAVDPESRPDRRTLVRTVRGVQTHEVQVVETFSDNWHRALLFRDLLRTDPQLAAEYEGVRRRLAADHGARPFAYERGKAWFIESVLGR
jgi:GrpB-like predicted nucleotidyltransferase (UPF0157 family)